MKNFLNLKSFLLAVLATLAVNVMASNKTNEEPTICQQWEVEDIATFFNNDNTQMEIYSGVVIDLTDAGTFRFYYKAKDDDKWYMVGNGQAVIDETTITLGDTVYEYTLSENKLTLSSNNVSFSLRATSGISAEP